MPAVVEADLELDRPERGDPMVPCLEDVPFGASGPFTGVAAAMIEIDGDLYDAGDHPVGEADFELDASNASGSSIDAHVANDATGSPISLVQLADGPTQTFPRREPQLSPHALRFPAACRGQMKRPEGVRRSSVIVWRPMPLRRVFG